MGASFVLLLVRALERDRLQTLVDEALALGLEPIVEAKDAGELETALATGAPVVGVNARDLGTFQVDPSRARQALALVPVDRVAVQMSGIRTRADYLDAAGGRADAVLIGEGLMRGPDPGRRLAELVDP